MMSFKFSGGVEVLGFISPTSLSDQYPVIDPLYGIDGLRNVGVVSDLNSIPNLRRRPGMIVGVNGGSEYYKLKVSPWTGTISDWELVELGPNVIVTGFTYNDNNVFTISRNDGVNLSSTIEILSGLTIDNGIFEPTNDSQSYVGTPIKRFRGINTVDGTSSYWTSTVKVSTPELDLGNDSSGNPRVITSDNSIIQDDILNGGNF